MSSPRASSRNTQTLKATCPVFENRPRPLAAPDTLSAAVPVSTRGLPAGPCTGEFVEQSSARQCLFALAAPYKKQKLLGEKMATQCDHATCAA